MPSKVTGRKDDLSFNKDADAWTQKQIYDIQGRETKPKMKRNPNWINDDPFEGFEPPRPGKKKKK